jgi:hypothetical protein
MTACIVLMVLIFPPEVMGQRVTERIDATNFTYGSEATCQREEARMHAAMKEGAYAPAIEIVTRRLAITIGEVPPA